MARLFNAYVIVDWSAASKPTTGADSIWVGVLKRELSEAYLGAASALNRSVKQAFDPRGLLNPGKAV